MIVVADSSPLNYLIQIRRATLLHSLYEYVHIPNAVMVELQHRDAPKEVAEWIGRPPQMASHPFATWPS